MNQTQTGNFNTASISVGGVIKTIQNINEHDRTEFVDSLLIFKEELAKINLPITKAAIVNADLDETIEEMKKEKPAKQTIQNRLQDVFNTIKEALGADNNVSKWDIVKKICGTAAKIGFELIT
jgi:hypothetical protein